MTFKYSVVKIKTKLIEGEEHFISMVLYRMHPASRIYYAMFYATQALLKSENIDMVKHSAVESALGYHFAKTGRIDPKYHRMLINARKIREM